MQKSAKTDIAQRAILVTGVLACAIGLLSGCVTLTKEAPTPSEPVAQEPTKPPCPALSVHELEREAIEHLDRGETDDARNLLDCALEDDPSSRRAQMLIRQLDVDPVDFLGARHYTYVVKPGETLSKIAEERLGDGMKFAILARYNGITVPANVVAGQRIKIPGNRPVEQPQPSAEDETEPMQTTPVVEQEPAPTVETAGSTGRYQDALTLEQQGDLEGAYEILTDLKAGGSDLPGIDDDLARLRSKLVADLEDKAYGLELAGKVDEAVETWQRLLEIDPRNIPAQLSIRRLTQ